MTIDSKISADALAFELLMVSKIQDIIRQKIPFVRSIESIESLVGLKLTRAEFGTNGTQRFFYEAKAGPDIYGEVHEALCMSGLTQGVNLLLTDLVNAGLRQEHQVLMYGIDDGNIQIFLRVNNPCYASNPSPP